MNAGEGALVTGGAGFVGSHVVETLTAAGHRVSVLDDLSRGSRDWVSPDVELFECDIRDAPGVDAVFDAARPGIVVHLAALHFIPAVDEAPELAQSINVDGTANVLSAAARAQVGRLVFASTAAVYPNASGPLSEEVAPAPIDLYGRTKLEGERLVASFGVRTGAACSSLRLFNVVGPRETNPHVLPEIVDQLRDGATELRLGNLEPRRDFVDVRDVAGAVAAVLARDAEGCEIFNVGSGRTVSVGELVQICASLLGYEVTIIQDPSRVRSVERDVLWADATRIALATGWRPQRALEQTLSGLLGIAAP